MRFSTVHGVFRTYGQTFTVPANGNRVRLSFTVPPTNGSGADIYLDSVASGQLAGMASFATPEIVFDRDMHGNLPQLRFEVFCQPASGSGPFGWTETVEIPDHEIR